MPRDLSYFLSYARADRAQVERLRDLLAPRLAIVRDFRFTGWIDDEIRVGEPWNDAIGAALAACDFGLMLLSPNFSASEFIRREELPHFIEQVSDAGAPAQTRIRKPLVPVMLTPTPLDGRCRRRATGGTAALVPPYAATLLTIPQADSKHSGRGECPISPVPAGNTIRHDPPVVPLTLTGIV